eukprot:513417-Prymnesium_polylepis.1
MALTYARRAVQHEGSRLWAKQARWELLSFRTQGTAETSTRLHAKLAHAPHPAEHLIATGSGTAQMAVRKAAVRKVGGEEVGGGHDQHAHAPRP